MVPGIEQISAVPRLKLSQPPNTCIEQFQRPELYGRVTDMDSLIQDVQFKVDQLKWEDLPVALEDDELFALVAYTYDSSTGNREGNLYYELNQDLRKRGVSERAALINTWGGYLYYLLKALEQVILRVALAESIADSCCCVVDSSVYNADIPRIPGQIDSCPTVQEGQTSPMGWIDQYQCRSACGQRVH